MPVSFFSAEINSRHNKLNMKLQGRAVLITTMEAHVQAFEAKPML